MTTTDDDDKFFERLRAGARALQARPDERELARIRARIQERIAPRASVAELLAGWFRPLAATLSAIAIAATLGLALLDDREPLLDGGAIETWMTGGTFSVGD
jgi:hypothetical protein